MLSSMPPERQRQATYAISISTFLQHAHFQVTAHAELFLETLFRYRSQGKFQIHGFAVMPNHVHVMITPAADQSTARSVQLIKGGYSFAAHKLTPKEIWHTGYHEHRVRDLDDYHNQLQYIANNPSAGHLRSDYPYVHTHPQYAMQLDPFPAHLLL